MRNSLLTKIRGELAKIKERVPIDIYGLHVACAEQAEMFMETSEFATDYDNHYRRSKLGLDLAQSEAEREIRKEPGKVGIEKVTESAIKAAVVLHPKVTAAREELLDAQQAADVAKLALETLRERRHMLKAEVDLFTSHYFEAKGVEPSEEVKEQTERDIANLRGEVGHRRRF